MCEPMSAASAAGLAMSTVSTGLTIADRMSSRGSALDNRSKALDTVLTQTVPSINESLASVYNSNNARAVQERDKAATENFDILRGMAEAKGTATVAAGEAGVGGASFANILSDFEMREGLAKATSDYNVATGAQRIADDNQAARTRAQAQINSTVNAAVNATPVPSAAGTWAGIGADVAGAGLKIGDRFGIFDSKNKIDPATGVTITKTGSTQSYD